MGRVGRDDFTPATVRNIAMRAGYRCSYPGCGSGTVGPAEDPEGTVNVGEACHICAASPGGPRYDASMTEE